MVISKSNFKIISMPLLFFLLVALLFVSGCKITPVNEAPEVNAGPDDTVTVDQLTALQGTVTDDGLPADGELQISWSVISGQVSAVEFSDASSPISTAIFHEAGTYVLKLFADDGELERSDEVTINVEPESNQVFQTNVWVEAEDGVLSGRLVVDSENDISFIHMPYGSSSDFDGSVAYTFDVLEADEYLLKTMVFSESGEYNSFFVGLDSQNAQGNENMIWDSKISNTYIEDEINWRNGNNLIDPKTWNLDVGEHTFIFWGRESQTKLDKIKLEKVSENPNTITTKLWHPYAEWEYQNPSYSGNPFDLEAQATFSNGVKPHLFYDGANTWKLRFMCDEVGTFTFSTSSTDSDLNGKTGTVICEDNPGKIGSLVPSGRDNKKFYDLGKQKAIVPNWIMFPALFEWVEFSDSEKNTWIENNIGKAGWIGIHTPGIANRWYDWNCDGNKSNCDGDNPDVRALEAYEELLDWAYERGIYVHLWQWWDKERDRHDKFFNNPVPRTRLRNYISDRLGAYPNLIIGHGFDNHEYVVDDPQYSNTWANDFKNRLAWHHFVEVRGGGSIAHIDLCPECNMKSWDSGADPYDFTYDILKTSYDDAGNEPVMETDRFRYRQDKIVDGKLVYKAKDVENSDEQRHWMWWLTMSGGTGTIWGNMFGMKTGSNPVQGIYSNMTGYSEEFNKVIKGWHNFWYETDTDPTHRFMADMERCNDLTDGYALCSEGKYYVFFKENTNSIYMDLNKMTGSFNVVAMDTKTGEFYSQGIKTSSYNRFVAPHSSDWAVAVGDFDQKDDDYSYCGDGRCDESFERSSTCSKDCGEFSGVVLEDDLQGSNKRGIKIGGTFTSEGYKPGKGENHILYTVPEEVWNGYVQVEVKGFDFSEFQNAESNSNSFYVFYDGRGINIPAEYNPDYRNNYFRWETVYRSNKHDGSDAGNRFKGKILMASPQTSTSLGFNKKAIFAVDPDDGSALADWKNEPNGLRTTWDPNKWYTVRTEWNNDDHTFRILRDEGLGFVEYWNMQKDEGKAFPGMADTQDVWHSSTPSIPYLPVDFKIRLGSGPGDKYDNDMPNIVYRNFKVVKYN